MRQKWEIGEKWLPALQWSNYRAPKHSDTVDQIQTFFIRNLRHLGAELSIDG